MTDPAILRTAKALAEAIPQLVTPPERRTGLGALGQFLAVLAIAGLPLACVIAVKLLSPAPSLGPTGACLVSQVRPDAGVSGHGTPGLPCPPASPSVSLKRESVRITGDAGSEQAPARTVTSTRTESLTLDALPSQTLRDAAKARASILSSAAFVLFIAVLIVALKFQYRTVARIWRRCLMENLRARHQPLPSMVPGQILFWGLLTLAVVLPWVWPEPPGRVSGGATIAVSAVFGLGAVWLVATVLHLPGIWRASLCQRPALVGGAVALVLGATTRWAIGEDILAEVFAPGGAGAPPVWAGPAVASAAAGLGALTAITALGTLTLGRNFPTAAEVEQRFFTLELSSHMLKERSLDLWEALAALAKPEDAAGSATPQPPLTNPWQSAKAAARLVEYLTTALVLVIVLGLVALSMALDAAAAGAPVHADTAKALRETSQTWLLLTGAALSLSVLALYLGPTLRAGSFAVAEALAAKAIAADDDERDAAAMPQAKPESQAAPAADTAWKVTLDNGILRTRSLTVTPVAVEKPAALPSPDTPPPPTKAEVTRKRLRADIEQEALVAARFGTDKAKFIGLLNISGLGGGFHALLGKTLTGNLTKLLTILAPGLASTLLTLL